MMRALGLRAGIGILVGALALLAGPTTAPVAAISAAPTLTGPAEGTTLENLGPTLTWTNPAGTTQYHLQVIPANNDGPGIDIIRDAATTFTIPAPPSWYGLLPDMTYTWRVRVSDATTAIGVQDASWGPWAEAHFRTPTVSSATIAPLTPAQGDVVSTLTPILQWGHTRFDIFYYEVQLTKDASFNTDPATATAMIYSSLRHGGVTSPWNSYVVPTGFPLEDNITYHWRVRPRVQGDGTPVAWSAIWSFQTNLGGAAAFTAEPMSFGLTAADATTCQMLGAATTFASTPTLTGLHYAFKYTGSGSVSTSFYLNDVPYFASSATLTGTSGCFRNIYGIPGGGPDTGSPLGPGTYRQEIWHAGQKLQSASFTVTPATALAIGPISVGTARGSGCRLTGVATSFPSGTQTVFSRLNTVGSGPFMITRFRGTTQIDTATLQETGPVRCWVSTWRNMEPGAWRVEVSVGGQVAQSVTFTVT